MTITEPTTEGPKTEGPLELESGREAIAERPLGVLTRPQGGRGWRDWLSTVDHKKIGIMYGVSAMVFFVVGGIEALLIRLQLAVPNGGVLSADVYNQVFTMHGVTMVFLFIMPLAAAFANYLIPLQIGARDVAFPRLNALSYWIWLSGAIFLNSSWIVGGGGADCGWFCYSPNSGVTFSPSHGVDFYAIGLLIAGIASLVSAINLIVTCLNMRAPGMDLFRMPVMTWMLLITQFLLLFALPVITVALFLLMFDRLFDASFFNPDMGADPLLWQHLFWIFGHPEVYIIILPAFGVVSEVIPTFSRKPIFGYTFMVFSGIAIGFMGWGVWAHHMFVSGIGPISVAAFSLSTMFIAVPTGVKVLNWLATMWGGQIRFTTAMLFAVGTVAMFTIGGLSGVTHALAPADTQQTDTYYIVAHFHYVIFGGGVLGLIGGLYYWWPKIFGFMLNERRGKINFWLMLIGFNLTFGPMHILGLQGMSRRIDTYSSGFGFEFWNMVATIGSFIIAVSVVVLFHNIWKSKREAADLPPPGPDPWDARSLEWMVPSPVPEHNFDEVPTVAGLDEWWHRKYSFDDNGKVVQIATAEEAAQDGSAKGVHLPSPSFWPLVLAVGLPLIGYGLIFNLWLCVPGGLLVGMGIFAWALEPVDDPDATHDHHDEDHDDDGDSNAAPATSGDDTAAAPAAPGDDTAAPAAPGDDTAAPATPGDSNAPGDSTAGAPATPGDSNVPGDSNAPGESTAHGSSTGISNTKLAMWLFLGSECLLFGGLISTYLLYKTRRGPDNLAIPTDVFDIPFTSISSFVLLMSSLTMVLALAALTRGDNHGARVWLLATSMLGGVFIGGQVYEFTSFLREGVGFTNNPASSAFYALTGFHGVHVSLGIVMLMSLFVASWQGKLRQEHSETVEVVGLYWHFVDVVWIFIFTVIYLVPA